MDFLDGVGLSPTEEVALFRGMFRQAGTVMLLIDFETGRIVGANPAALRFYGYPGTTLLGMPISSINILPPEIIRQRMEEARRRQRGYFHFRHRLFGGETREVAVYSGPVVVRARTYLYSIVHDISEEVRLRRERESLARRLRLAMDAGGIIAWELQENGKVYLAWPSGMPPQEGTNPWALERVLEAFAPEDRHLVEEAAWNCLLHGHPIHLEVRTGDGRWLYCAGERMEDGDGIRAVGVGHDITAIKEQERMERERRELAEALAAAKDRFLRILGHEIRTPLSGIVGMLEMVGDKVTSEEAKEQLALAQGCARSLMRLLSDVLDLCRLDAGQMPLVGEIFSPAALCQVQAMMFQPLAQAKGVDLRAETSVPESVLVSAPKVRLEQVLSNLLSNAVKFTERGEIVVSCQLEDEDGCLVLAVRDTGCGMEEELLARLFEPYAQGVLESRFARGTGLGLSIVHALVQRMGGQVDVESRPGVGSRFVVRVPVRPAMTAASPVVSDDACLLQPTAWDILVAEDDPVNQMVIRAFLERLGHRVWTVDSGQAALDAVRSRSFHAAFLDISMPGMDGEVAARRIRAICPELPLVAVSAYVTPEDQSRFAAVMDFVLSKPISRDSVRAILAQIAQMRRPSPAPSPRAG